MRKIALPTLAALALALGACGGGATQDEEPAGADEAPAVADGVTGDAVEAGADFAAEADSADAVATPTPTPSPTPDVAASASAPTSPSPAVTPAVAAAVTAPPAFALCRACHSTEAGQNGIGPTLAGVYGAKSAHISSFAYSSAMEGADLTWNEATLDRYLENPAGVVPGTSMSFAGVKNAAQRKAIVDYLKTL